MEAAHVFDAPETFAYIEHEVSCPYCEGHMLGTLEDSSSTYYICGTCGNDWVVLEG